MSSDPRISSKKLSLERIEFFQMKQLFRQKGRREKKKKSLAYKTVTVLTYSMHIYISNVSFDVTVQIETERVKKHTHANSCILGENKDKRITCRRFPDRNFLIANKHWTIIVQRVL